MITRWRLFHFKSVKSDTSLEFGPLTIFAGPNSSGKSTWIQSLLLVSQTLSNRVRSRSVVLNGSLTRLGQFDDLKSYGGDANQIVIGCECEPRGDSPIMALEGPQTTGRRMVFYGRSTDPLKGASCELAFDANIDSPQRELYQLQPQLYSCRIGSTVRGEDNIDAKSWIEIRRAELSGVAEKVRMLGIEEPENDLIKKSLELDVSLDDDSLQDIKSEYATAEPVGCLTRHFLPENLGLRINVAEEEARAMVSTICEESPRGIRRRMGTDGEVAIPAQVLAVLKEALGEELWSQVLPEAGRPILFTNETTFVVTLRDWSTQVRRLPIPRRTEVRRRIQATPGLTGRLVAAFKEGKPTRFIVVPNPPPSDVMDGIMYIDYFFTNAVKYLGPLRDEPKALYPWQPESILPT